MHHIGVKGRRCARGCRESRLYSLRLPSLLLVRPELCPFWWHVGPTGVTLVSDSTGFRRGSEGPIRFCMYLCAFFAATWDLLGRMSPERSTVLTFVPKAMLLRLRRIGPGTSVSVTWLPYFVTVNLNAEHANFLVETSFIWGAWDALCVHLLLNSGDEGFVARTD